MRTIPKPTPEQIAESRKILRDCAKTQHDIPLYMNIQMVNSDMPKVFRFIDQIAEVDAQQKAEILWLRNITHKMPAMEVYLEKIRDVLYSSEDACEDLMDIIPPPITEEGVLKFQKEETFGTEPTKPKKEFNPSLEYLLEKPILSKITKSGCVDFRFDCPVCDSGIYGRVQFDDEEEKSKCNCLVTLPTETKKGEKLCGICWVSKLKLM